MLSCAIIRFEHNEIAQIECAAHSLTRRDNRNVCKYLVANDVGVWVKPRESKVLPTQAAYHMVELRVCCCRKTREEKPRRNKLNFWVNYIGAELAMVPTVVCCYESGSPYARRELHWIGESTLGEWVHCEFFYAVCRTPKCWGNNFSVVKYFLKEGFKCTRFSEMRCNVCVGMVTVLKNSMHWRWTEADSPNQTKTFWDRFQPWQKKKKSETNL